MIRVIHITNRGKKAWVNISQIVKIEKEKDGCVMFHPGGKLTICDQDYDLVIEYLKTLDEHWKEDYEQTAN